MERLTKRREYNCACWNGNQDFNTHKRYLDMLDRLAVYEDILFNADGTERIAIDRLSEICAAEREGTLMTTPFVAMVDQVLIAGEFSGRKRDTAHNGVYAAVYVDKKKWGTPLIDICGEAPYRPEAAVKRTQALKNKAEELAVKGSSDGA